MVGKIQDKVQLSPAKAEVRAKLGMTENHSKHLVGVKFCHRTLALLFLRCFTTILSGWVVGWVTDAFKKKEINFGTLSQSFLTPTLPRPFGTY